MRVRKVNILLISILMIFHSHCNPQNKESKETCIDREPYAAGKFYSGRPDELKTDLKALFDGAVQKKCEHVVAIISPHAGYVYSGQVAASAFNQINRNKKYKHIFVLGSSHVKYMGGASVYYQGDYKTPLGKVKIDRELAKKLVDEYDVFTLDKEADAYEHSLEVQLPFLQYVLGEDMSLIPIIIGSQSAQICKEIASILKPYLNEENLFVISTDFSHYPSYKDAMTVDIATANSILLNDPGEFLQTLRKNTDDNIPNLATSICGWTSVLTLLYMTEGNDRIGISPILYKNSGDTPYGDKNRVVGYYALAFSMKDSGSQTSGTFLANPEDRKELLQIARQTVESYVKKRVVPVVNEGELNPDLRIPSGAFVTLHKEGNLRGCIGRFNADEPLYKVVQDMAVSSSTQDSRFPPVKPDELGQIDIEISVLTPLKKIESIDEIILGKHGIYIKKGFASGTFLPQVATETGWNLEEFLGHCARDKAGIGWEGWKDAEIYTYEAIIFSEKEFGLK
ncbi:MAG TPA: AmmeMemoRadiSam system protein B [Bacteroidales bacterium]|nr:AmmeMemoRadiSam system protein B [Bacteroidales bacterium]HRZ20133.1 AmmeMemoRadiSam system protein B [Bacteroidales bacterium]